MYKKINKYYNSYKVYKFIKFNNSKVNIKL